MRFTTITSADDFAASGAGFAGVVDGTSIAAASGVVVSSLAVAGSVALASQGGETACFALPGARQIAVHSVNDDEGATPSETTRQLCC